MVAFFPMAGRTKLPYGRTHKACQLKPNSASVLGLVPPIVGQTSDITMGQSCTVTSTSAGSGAGEVDRRKPMGVAVCRTGEL